MDYVFVFVLSFGWVLDEDILVVVLLAFDETMVEENEGDDDCQCCGGDFVGAS